MSRENNCWLKKLVCWWPGNPHRQVNSCWLIVFVIIAVLLSAVSGMAAESDSKSSPTRKVGIIVYGAPFLKSADGFRAGLAAAGYREGVEVQYSVHNVNKNRGSVPILVQEFLQHHYDLILAVTTPVAAEVKKATQGSNIPVLFTTVADPLKSNILVSLSKPGGNVSGVSHISFPLMMKRLLLFAEAFPSMKRVAVLHNPEEKFLAGPLEQFKKLVSTETGIKIVNIQVRNAREMKSACERLSRNDVDGIFMVPDPLPMAMFGELLACSRREKLPLMVIDNILLAKGGVIGYSPDVYDVGFQAAGMAVHIFQGAEVGNLPVQNPDKVKLVVSLKEVKALGLTPSRDIVRRADEVIR
ncbi:MAG: ABC transporter substrate-binding protein [Pseudomonadota bacterium]|nr:ABC transporter substrate-binding protein [Pseudomonadota bacterium]